MNIEDVKKKRKITIVIRREECMGADYADYISKEREKRGHKLS